MTNDFKELDRILGVADAGTSIEKLPERRWVEDQDAANDAVAKMYDAIGLKRPKPVWAKSPRVIHEAIEMLRNIHTGQRHNFIDAIVPYDPDTLRREAQKTMLECLIERDLTVTMGASLQRSFPYSGARAVYKLHEFLSHSFRPKNLSGRTAPAGWGDVVLYSAGLPSMVLELQTFCICPYVKVAWMCSPGKMTVDDIGTTWTWMDGYTVVIPHDEPKEEDHPSLEGKSIRSMLEHAENVKKKLEKGESTPRLLEGK